MATDRNNAGNAFRDPVRHIEERRDRQSRVTFEGEFLNAIAIAKERPFARKRKIPFCRHEIVNAQNREHLAVQAIAPLQPFVARIGQRQRRELFLEERVHHGPGLFARENFSFQPIFPRLFFQRGRGRRRNRAIDFDLHLSALDSQTHAVARLRNIEQLHLRQGPARQFHLLYLAGVETKRTNHGFPSFDRSQNRGQE